MLVATQVPPQIADRQVELIDEHVAGRAHGDERAALGHEAVEVADPDGPESTAILRTDRQRIKAVQHLARRLVRQDDHVEALAQTALADVGVVQRFDGNSYCSSTHRVQPSSTLPPVHG
jgi:hypothetical protein